MDKQALKKCIDGIYEKANKWHFNEKKLEQLKRELMVCETWKDINKVKYQYFPTDRHFKGDDMRAEEMSSAKVVCKCGHRVIMPPRKDRKICSWCGNYVYKDKKTEFKYKLLEEEKKQREGE